MNSWLRSGNLFGKNKKQESEIKMNMDESNFQLLEASRTNNIDLVNQLIASGADVNCRTNDGWTPLIEAAIHDSKLTTLLLSHGADPNLATDHGYTPLHRAAGHGNESVVIELLDAGAAIDARDEFGQTAHKIAMHEMHDEVAEILEIRLHEKSREEGKNRIMLEGSFAALFLFAPQSSQDYHLVKVQFEDGSELQNVKVYNQSELELPAEYMNKVIKTLSLNLDQP